jgi:hypothetical protein
MAKHRFQKGDKKPENSGRKAGVQNHMTVECKRVLEAAYTQMGGLDALVAWAQSSKERLDIFYSQMWIRLLPFHVQGDVDGTLKLTYEEVQKRLEDKGLPTQIFQPPLIDITPFKINEKSD